MAEVSPPPRGRVVQLLGPSTGGIRRHVAHLGARLAEGGWSVETAGPAGVLGGLAPLDHVIEVPTAAAGGRALVQARLDLARVVAGADVVHAHGLKAGWLAASLRSRPPLVVTVHNLVLPAVMRWAAPALQVLEAGLPARADHVIAVSADIARRFSGVAGAGRISVVAPAFPRPEARRPPSEVRSGLGIGEGARLIVSVGRLHAQKGFDLLVEAMVGVHRCHPDARLAIVGAGPAEAELRRRVADLGLDDVVVLAGPSACAADELAAADVVVLASRWEGWPLVLAEAVSMGVPVVATAVGGVPDVVVDGVTGRLVPPGDPTELAHAIGDTLDDPAGATARADAARSRLEARFPPEAMIEAVESIYRAVRR